MDGCLLEFKVRVAVWSFPIKIQKSSDWGVLRLKTETEVTRQMLGTCVKPADIFSLHFLRKLKLMRDLPIFLQKICSQANCLCNQMFETLLHYRNNNYFFIHEWFIHFCKNDDMKCTTNSTYNRTYVLHIFSSFSVGFYTQIICSNIHFNCSNVYFLNWNHLQRVPALSAFWDRVTWNSC